jgi:hypothetical protein
VRCASEEDAQKSMDALNGMKSDDEHVLKMERVEGSKEFDELVRRGVVDVGEVEGLTVLQTVGGNL